MSAASHTETAPAALDTTRGLNVMVVGVGGQGVLMISKALALIGQRQGLQVKQSEVHGMAKRGGVVFSHVRFGAEVWSPTIARGEADVLIALEWAEGLRWLEFLRPQTGVFIADTRRIVPPFACRSRRHGAPMAYARETPAEVLDKVGEGYALDATAIARGLGESRAANTVLLGVLSASMDVSAADWLAVLETLAPPKSRAINLKAFEAGRAWADAARGDPSLSFDAGFDTHVTQADLPDVSVRHTINAAWCKGCDICVKLCPERCLALNEHQVAYLKAPQACTGCHVCEWLCPDFAIDVQTTLGT
ncbi:2-oxoacid:acceptor oxidoreductase family protein [Rhodopila globiformis]|uniref:Pyruvate ferredoxin oxidoreductase n=1 Tax=Rhodopila globiformis TaxID=1071 RepID=A0A2S6NFF6_RHOGL|nr:2-oxoacid:acceptor oxidoreductase family protein [Rhodopila globiformis]PPQ33346.1 pyruvate ferredoxin oxidoreductase [Rhodopila globiformis]